MSQRPFPLLATCWTSAGNVRPRITADTSPHSLAERIAAVAAAGYTGIGFELADLNGPLQRGELPDLRRRLADAGMTTVEVEFIDDWFVHGERRRVSDERRSALLSIAEQLGAHHIKVGGGRASDAVDIDVVRAEFDILADEAAEHGTRIALEPGAFSALADLNLAAQIINSSTSTAGGVLLDIWHLYRTGFEYARLPEVFALDRLIAVELDDGEREPLSDLFDDTFDRRLLCGRGDFDVVAFIRVVQRIGFAGPWGVENMSATHRARPIAEALSDAASAAQECLAIADGGGAE